jgi:DNA-binding response OmpR family regulator
MLRRGKHEGAQGTRTGAAHILVVNDDVDAAELLCRVLTQAGYVVDRAHDQSDAIGKVSDAPPDCVLLDLGAGGIGTNLKVLDGIRTSNSADVASVRIVLATAQTNNRMFSWQAGVDAFLLRPFHVDDLLRDIADVLERPDEERARHRRNQLAEATATGRVQEARPWEHQTF